MASSHPRDHPGVIAGGGSDVVLLAGRLRRGDHRIDLDGRGAAIRRRFRSAITTRPRRLARRRRYARCPRWSGRRSATSMPPRGSAESFLDSVVDTITANRETWLTTMMDEELAPPARAVARHPSDRGRDRDRDAHRPPHPARAVHVPVPNAGTGGGDRPECRRALRRWRVHRGDAGWRLAEERPEVPGHLAWAPRRSASSWVACSTQRAHEVEKRGPADDAGGSSGRGKRVTLGPRTGDRRWGRWGCRHGRPPGRLASPGSSAPAASAPAASVPAVLGRFGVGSVVASVVGSVVGAAGTAAGATGATTGAARVVAWTWAAGEPFAREGNACPADEQRGRRAEDGPLETGEVHLHSYGSDRTASDLPAACRTGDERPVNGHWARIHTRFM